MLCAGILLSGCTQKKADQPASATSADGPDRTILPVKEPVRPTYTELDVRNVTAPPRFEVKAPEGAPNVVVILIDDMGWRPKLSEVRLQLPPLTTLLPTA
jgi:arylsulfatase